MSQLDLTAGMLDTRLDDVETRVLGCLMEKAVLTPRHYPLTMNGLRNACNQKTGRDPVVSWHEHLLHAAVDRLKRRGLVRIIEGGRARKIAHSAAVALNVKADGIAVLSVLMLRGPLSVADLLEAAGRLYPFDNEAQLRETLQGLLEHQPAPLAAALPVNDDGVPQRFCHCLSDSNFAATAAQPPNAGVALAASTEAGSHTAKEIEWMQEELSSIRDLLDADSGK